MGLPAKMLAPDEQVVLVLRRHAKALIRPALILLVVVPLATYLAALVPDGDARTWARVVIAVVAGLIVLRWTVWPFVVWWNTIYAVTDRRLVIRSGVFSRSGHDMPLSRLNDVSFSHSVLGRMLGYGTLVVESAGERGQLVLDEVPQVERVQRTLYRLSDAAREPRADLRDDDLRDDDLRDADDSHEDTIVLRDNNSGRDNPTLRLDGSGDRA